MDKEILVKRLAFVKYLFQLSNEQGKMPEPMNAVSVLTLHDCAEMLLNIAAEKINIKVQGINFMDYWIKFDEKGIELSVKESMRRLNKCRVNLKHHSTLPSKFDVDTHKSTLTVFINENFEKLFDLKFDEISLIDLVDCDSGKQRLEDAKTKMENKDFQNASFDIAVAFKEVIRDFVNTYKDEHGRNMFRNKTRSIQRVGGDPIYRSSRVLDEVVDAVNELNDDMEIVCLGLDYSKYAKFKSYIPFVRRMADGSYKGNYFPNMIYSNDKCKFCLDYVIECALKLQQY